MRPEQSAQQPEGGALLLAIKKLGGRDRLGMVGEAVGVGGGAIAGGLAAAPLASAAGASTLLGSTTLASFLGGVFVTTTPIGWVVGAALAGGAAAYAIASLVHSGGEQDEVRRSLIEALRSRLNVGEGTIGAAPDLAVLAASAVEQGRLQESMAQRLLQAVERGLLPADTAKDRLCRLMQEEAPPRAAGRGSKHRDSKRTARHA